MMPLVTPFGGPPLPGGPEVATRLTGTIEPSRASPTDRSPDAFSDGT